MLEILRQQLEKTKIELEEAFTARTNAGAEAEGEYTNRIDKLARDYNDIQSRIDKFADAQTPDKIQILLYVIVSNKRKIKKNLPSECFSLIRKDRYHHKDSNQWRPFTPGDTIQVILQKFRTDYGYQFQEQYLDSPDDKEIRLDIDTCIDRSLAVIDPFSLWHQNQEIANDFDTERVAGVIIPVGRDLIKHDVLYKYIEEKRSATFPKSEMRMKCRPHSCSFYERDIADISTFNRRLLHFLYTKFPTINTIQTNTPVRKLPVGFR